MNLQALKKNKYSKLKRSLEDFKKTRKKPKKDSKYYVNISEDEYKKPEDKPEDDKNSSKELEENEDSSEEPEDNEDSFEESEEYEDSSEEELDEVVKSRKI
ncbi:9719_t:CDS:2 [Dentiscutata heterogama]|uniref:9719_t:CDS:1 n=1 Tax=Dentiscutata heterogama TaxID=1316150 RepID=A0ACA9L486_9GLOM|nr:9719_t:CDS:2 [Dentiscutata heterogama]